MLGPPQLHTPLEVGGDDHPRESGGFVGGGLVVGELALIGHFETLNTMI